MRMSEHRPQSDRYRASSTLKMQLTVSSMSCMQPQELETRINHLRRATSCSDQFEFQKALSSFEAHELQGQWRQQGLNAVSEAAEPKIMDTDDHSNVVSFHSGQHGHDPILMSTSLSNQSNINVLRKQECKVPRASQLQRRHSLSAMELLKVVDTYQQEAANCNLVKSSEQDCFQIQANQPPAGPADVQVFLSPKCLCRTKCTVLYLIRSWINC